MVFISAMKSNANANANDDFVDIAKKEEEKRYNLLTYNLLYTDEKIHKAFDKYFERRYNEKMYGHPFIGKEVLKIETESIYFMIQRKKDLLMMTFLVFLMQLVALIFLFGLG